MGGVIAGLGAALSSSLGQLLLLLFFISAVAFIGVFFSGLPEIEYIIVLAVNAIIALAILRWWQYIVILPGIFMGYFWGSWMADILVRSNTEGKTESI